MDRNVILESNKQTKIHDEGTESVDNRAGRKGEFALVCLMVLLMAYNLLRRIQSDDLTTAFWVYTSVIYLHKYRICRQKIDLVVAAVAMVTMFADLLLYFLHT